MIKNTINIFKLFNEEFDIYIWFIIFNNNIVCMDKKYVFYKCTLIIRLY